MKKLFKVLLLSSLVLLMFSCSYTPRPPKKSEDVPNNTADGNDVFKNDSSTSSDLVFKVTPYDQDTTFFTNKGETTGSITKKIKSISTTITKIQGVESAPYGIVFLKDQVDDKKDNFKFFCSVLITADGYYLIGKMINGKWYTIQSGEALDIKQGFNKTNTITINYPEISIAEEINRDSEFELLINGNLVTTFKVFKDGDTIVDKPADDNTLSEVGYIAVTYQRNTANDVEEIKFTKIKTTLHPDVTNN